MDGALPASKYICELEVKVHSSHHILCGVVFPTPESLLHVSRHPCQHMCAINGTNTVLEMCRIVDKCKPNKWLNLRHINMINKYLHIWVPSLATHDF